MPFQQRKSHTRLRLRATLDTQSSEQEKSTLIRREIEQTLNLMKENLTPKDIRLIRSILREQFSCNPGLQHLIKRILSKSDRNSK